MRRRAGGLTSARPLRGSARRPTRPASGRGRWHVRSLRRRRRTTRAFRPDYSRTGHLRRRAVASLSRRAWRHAVAFQRYEFAALKLLPTFRVSDMPPSAPPPARYRGALSVFGARVALAHWRSGRRCRSISRTYLGGGEYMRGYSRLSFPRSQRAAVRDGIPLCDPQDGGSWRCCSKRARWRRPRRRSASMTMAPSVLHRRPRPLEESGASADGLRRRPRRLEGGRRGDARLLSAGARRSARRSAAPRQRRRARRCGPSPPACSRASGTAHASARAPVMPPPVMRRRAAGCGRSCAVCSDDRRLRRESAAAAAAVPRVNGLRARPPHPRSTACVRELERHDRRCARPAPARAFVVRADHVSRRCGPRRSRKRPSSLQRLGLDLLFLAAADVRDDVAERVERRRRRDSPRPTAPAASSR